MGASLMDFPQLSQALLNGLMLASVYALVALGLTLVFGLLDIVNFAHGQLLLLGAYLTFAVVDAGAPYVVALLVSVVVVSCIGLVLDAALFARVRATPINGLLISIGLIAILVNVIHEIWGPTPRNVPPPVQHVFRVGDVSLSASRLMIIVGTLVVLGALSWFLQRTRAGMALRATAQNAEAAQLMGIAIERTRHASFAVGSGLAALAGSFLAAVFPVEPVLGESPLVKGFIVLIIGGAGSPLGAVLGAVILGFAESFGVTLWSTGTAELLTFVLLIAILFLRPQGLVRVAREATL